MRYINEVQTEYPLDEKTYRISRDVDFIYNKAFKHFIDNFNKQDYKGKLETKTLSSSMFTSPQGIEGSIKNPVIIVCGGIESGSSYNPFRKQITISINTQAEDLIASYNFDYVKIAGVLSSKKYASILNEITEPRIKSTIYHELSHWLNDTFNNSNIEKQLVKGLTRLEYELLTKQDFDMSFLEIDAQIHGIKQLKRSVKNWDTLSLSDVFTMYTALITIVNTIYKKYGKDTLVIYLQLLIKRMNREHLLGRNMEITDILEYVTEGNIYSRGYGNI